jgi:high-affinity nickel-transport protein
MITLFSILLLGFFLGMRHATDCDHVVAVTTIVSRQRSLGSAALTGVFWGVGHSLTLLVVGGAIIFFGIVIPERLGMSLEFCVALMLVLLGTLNIRSAMRSFGDDKNEWEPEVALDRVFGRMKWYGALRPLIIGVVHGLAGSAAVALLVLPIIQRPIWAWAYLLIFGVGTVAGMMLMTTTIAIPVTYTARFPFFRHHLATAAGVLSLGFGLFLAYQIGFVNGLFTH